MTKLFLAFAGLTCFSLTGISQILISPNSLNFGSKPAYLADSLSVTLTNTLSEPVAVGALSSSDSAFSLRMNTREIPANGTAIVWVRIKAVHNITYSERVYISVYQTAQTFSIPVQAVVSYAEARYASTQNLWDTQLKTALTTIVTQGHNALGYTNGRDALYGSVDDFNNDDHIECVYTGRVAVFNSRSGASGASFNCEHTWPQSKFNENDPMVSDLNHLYSSDENANGKRSNYPFGIVTNASWEEGGSKLGNLSTGGTGFEPRNVHKGNVARTMMYFITRYPTNYGGFYDTDQDAVFRKWVKSDPVTLQDRQRNDRVQTAQGNRNAFVDHQEFVDRIYDFLGGDRPKKAKIALSTLNLKFPASPSGTETKLPVLIGNTGTAALSISSATPSVAGFSVKIPGSIPAGSFDTLWVSRTSDGTSGPQGTVTIQANIGSYLVVLNGMFSGDFNNGGSGGQGGGNPGPTGTTLPVTSLAFGSIQQTSVSVFWSLPAGFDSKTNKVVVLASEGSAPTAASGLLAGKVANSVFTSAPTAFNSTGKLVYTGTGTTFSLTGLSAGTTYFTTVYVLRNDSLKSVKTESSVKTASATGIVGTTSPVTALSFGNIKSTSASISWTLPSGFSSSTNKVVILASEGSAPSDGFGLLSGAVANSDFSAAQTAFESDGKLVYAGTGTTFSLTGLKASTPYFASAYVLRNDSLLSIKTEASATTAATGGGSGGTITQTFENWTATASYGDSKAASTTGTGEWTITNAYKATGTTSGDGYVLSGAASPRLRNAAGSAVTSPEISGGIKSFSFLYRQWDGTPATTMIVETSADGVTFTPIESKSIINVTTETYSATISDANAKFLRVRNSGEERICLDDFSITANGPVSVEETNLPSEFRFIGNYPNPFNPSTTFRYMVPVAGQVTVTVVDNLGRVVSSWIEVAQTAGLKESEFMAVNMASGLYLVRIQQGVHTSTGRILLMK